MKSSRLTSLAAGSPSSPTWSSITNVVLASSQPAPPPTSSHPPSASTTRPQTTYLTLIHSAIVQQHYAPRSRTQLGHQKYAGSSYTAPMAGDEVDPRMMSVKPRLRYNTIGGVNGPLVILENVRIAHTGMRARAWHANNRETGQIPPFQRDRVAHAARWIREEWSGFGG